MTVRQKRLAVARLLSRAEAAFRVVLAAGRTRGVWRLVQMNAYARGHDAFVAAERLLGAPLPWITEHPRPAATLDQARLALRTIEELRRRRR